MKVLRDSRGRRIGEEDLSHRVRRPLGQTAWEASPNRQHTEAIEPHADFKRIPCPLSWKSISPNSDPTFELFGIKTHSEMDLG